MSTTNLAHGASNAPTFDDLLKVCNTLGEEFGKGKDTLSKLYLKVHEAAFLGTLDVDHNKHGQSVDDAQKLAEAYSRAQSAATVFDAKAANGRKLASCIRTMVRLGMWPKGGQGEPLAMVNSFMTKHQTMRKDPVMCKKFEDPSNALLKLARAQIKRDHLISANEFDAFLLKKDPSLKTEEDWLEATRKSATKAKSGNGVSLDAHVADAVIRACTTRLKAIVVARVAAQTP